MWLALAKATEGDAATTVGLFDSGSGKAYWATVSQVVQPPSSESEGAGETIRVPADQAELMPSYYRESPFSRAWMRVSKIEPLHPFFPQYSFLRAPKLPGYAPATLLRLAGNKIVAADELRSMDTTIWEIRPAEPLDPDEKILLSVAALPSAVCGEVVRCKADTILHITDLHFALGRFRSQHAWKIEGEASGKHTMMEAVASAV